ncbi:MAG: hypothetical protein FJ150_03055 [Euryarchaeota archaeon]|nr:hypothetical protein [Euryarchaeota archaeon]
MNDLKITKILFIILIITVILEAAFIYIYSPYSGVKCPNCNSTNTKILAIDEYEPEYECQNCGAHFFEGGFIWGYDDEINAEYNKTTEQPKYHLDR